MSSPPQRSTSEDLSIRKRSSSLLNRISESISIAVSPRKANATSPVVSPRNQPISTSPPSFRFSKEGAEKMSVTISPKSIDCGWEVIIEKETVRQQYLEQQDARIPLFQELIDAPVLDLERLRELSWDGIPTKLRITVWQLLLGCLPLEKMHRSRYADGKQKEFAMLYERHMEKMTTKSDIELLTQIQVDCPRTMPKGAPSYLFKELKVLHMMERILLVWSKENPNVDYFQGLGDIAGELILGILGSYLDLFHVETEENFTDMLNVPFVEAVESETYWCLTRMLNPMNRYYSIGLFPGMQKMMDKLEELIKLVNPGLLTHMESHSVEFVQFSLRWMLCLLTRELPALTVHRLWDTYFSEGPDYASFHIYVCAAFLLLYESELKNLDFSEMIVFLQKLPTDHWDETDAVRLVQKACEIGDMEVAAKESFNTAVQATGLVVVLLVVALATQTSFLRK